MHTICTRYAAYLVDASGYCQAIHAHVVQTYGLTILVPVRSV